MKKKKDITLVGVFEEMACEDRPAYKRVNFVDGRRIEITVHDGDSNAVFHMAGAKGGKGNVMIVPLNELFNLVDTLRAQKYTVFDDDALPSFGH